MATDYVMSGSRIGLDGAVSITWQAACDIDVTGWDTANQAIVAVNHHTQTHTPIAESMKLRWRNATDTGTFADLITGSGELRAGTSAGCITNGDPVASACGCIIYTQDSVSEEVENESPLQTASLTASAKQYEIETQWCIDFSNALDGKNYEFELYSVTGSETLGTLTASITTAAGETEQIVDTDFEITVEQWQIVDTDFEITVEQWQIVDTAFEITVQVQTQQIVDRDFEITVEAWQIVDTDFEISVEQWQIVDTDFEITVQTQQIIDTDFEITIEAWQIVDTAFEITVQGETEQIVDRDFEITIESWQIIDTDFEITVEQWQIIDTDFEITVQIEQIVDTDFEITIQIEQIIDVDFEITVQIEQIVDTDFEITVEGWQIVDTSFEITVAGLIEQIVDTDFEITVEAWQIVDTDFEITVEQWQIVDTDFEITIQTQQIIDTDFEITIESWQIIDTDFEITVQIEQIIDTDFEITVEAWQIVDTAFEITVQIEQIIDVDFEITVQIEQIVDTDFEITVQTQQIVDTAFEVTIEAWQIVDVSFQINVTGLAVGSLPIITIRDYQSPFDQLTSLPFGDILAEGTSSTVTFRVYNNFNSFSNIWTAKDIKIGLSLFADTEIIAALRKELETFILDVGTVEIRCVKSSELESANPAVDWTPIVMTIDQTGQIFGYYYDDDFDTISGELPHNFNEYEIRLNDFPDINVDKTAYSIQLTISWDDYPDD